MADGPRPARCGRTALTNISVEMTSWEQMTQSVRWVKIFDGVGSKADAAISQAGRDMRRWRYLYRSK
ncbi:hypothetical protein TIFTF001_012358 [Ficus carica]|uniref:Uncharacterized protein n=1 Tax=Ficus carica TaxID=3494 RepID=A0AA88A067_FICCA|nr:hypothetical protein TIFTF001_012358 [Ficus carica]